MTEKRESPISWTKNAPYACPDDGVSLMYHAQCFCGAVTFAATHDPIDAKLCHCPQCQRLHGAPFQWAVIFHKPHIRFTSGVDQLVFFNPELAIHERILPCKLSCGLCHSPIADEGRRMFLAFGPLFDFGAPPHVPPAFKPSCHIFYGSRTIDVMDHLPKFSGHKDHSTRLD